MRLLLYSKQKNVGQIGQRIEKNVTIFAPDTPRGVQ